MTNKFVFDESSHALHRVVGYAHTWEQLAPGIRVRRRVIKGFEPERGSGLAEWLASFGPDFDDGASGHRAARP